MIARFTWPDSRLTSSKSSTYHTSYPVASLRFVQLLAIQGTDNLLNYLAGQATIDRLPSTFRTNAVSKL